MSKQKRKAIIDDGMSPELVYGADFDGYLGIPLIRKPDKLIVPSDIVPFTKRNRIEGADVAIGFYEMDTELLKSSSLRRFILMNSANIRLLHQKA